MFPHKKMQIKTIQILPMYCTWGLERVICHLEEEKNFLKGHELEK